MKNIEQTTLPHRLSIIVPLYNEEENVIPLIEGIHHALNEYRHPWELVLVNDGSTDNSEQRILAAIEQYGEHVKLLSLQRNFGQTAAMQAGIDSTAGDVLITMDGDLQNDPCDIPRLVKRLLEEDLDLVAGWRVARKDSLLRRIPSHIANRLIGRITGVSLHDYGCTLKAYRTDIIKGVRLYGDMHRLIPAWVAATTSTSRIKEEIVNHYARRHGTSKYGLGRTYRVILDLLSVYFFMRFKSRPGHFFGRLGLMFGSLGSLMLGYLFFIKMFLNEDIGTRPMLLIGVLFIVVAVQLLTTGVLSELLARTYYESSDIKSYGIRKSTINDFTYDKAWKHNT